MKSINIIMKPVYLLIPFLFLFLSCEKQQVKKPESLIGKDKMIEMLTDIHIAEATLNNRRNQDSTLQNSSSADFYYSILEKYQVADTTFEKSFIFYASNPRDFEKMYRQVMNKLNEMEQEFSGRKNDMLDLEIEKKNK